MIPLRDMPAAHLADAPGLATDLDDTLTTHGAGLSATTLSALQELQEMGVPCVIATGRPVGWAQVLASLLPVRAVVAENGGAWALREGTSVRVAFLDDEPTRREGLARAREVADELMKVFPVLSPVTEWASRGTDVVVDIGERVAAPPAVVRDALSLVRKRGLHGVASTVHLHVSQRAPDKTLGLRRALDDLGLDGEALRARWIYVGDSPNDAPAFAAVSRSVGVRNVLRFADSMPAWPRYVTDGEGPEGFAELVAALREARR